MRTVRVTKTFIDREQESQDLEINPRKLEDILKLARSVNSAMDRATVRSISFENLDRDWMEQTDFKYKKTPVNIVSQKTKGVIKIPNYMVIPDALRIFNIGYGRALGHAMRYIRNNFPEHEETLKKELLTEVDEYNVYIGGDK